MNDYYLQVIALIKLHEQKGTLVVTERARDFPKVCDKFYEPDGLEWNSPSLI